MTVRWKYVGGDSSDDELMEVLLSCLHCQSRFTVEVEGLAQFFGSPESAEQESK